MPRCPCQIEHNRIFLKQKRDTVSDSPFHQPKNFDLTVPIFLPRFPLPNDIPSTGCKTGGRHAGKRRKYLLVLQHGRFKHCHFRRVSSNRIYACPQPDGNGAGEGRHAGGDSQHPQEAVSPQAYVAGGGHGRGDCS